MLDGLEAELRRSEISEANQRWLALVKPDGSLAWRAEYDEWGNMLREDNPEHLAQLIHLPGQQYAKETGLCYNRHRYYDLWLGRYITQDPIGLKGGLNPYICPSNPVNHIDPLGLAVCKVLFPDYPNEYSPGKTSTWLGGHGGVLGYDDKGVTAYYEYGRYPPSAKGVIGVKLPTDDGNIRRVGIPNLNIGNDGNPTDDSWRKLKESLSSTLGHNTRVELTCNENANLQATYNYIDNIAKNKNRAKYSWNPFLANHCRTFSENAFKEGE